MQFDLSIRDVSPTSDAVKMKSAPDDGIHTGGCWLMGERVYKPLDARPYMNADFHVPTLEAEMLAAFADDTTFTMCPKNWEVEELNGRRWLVRDKAIIVGQDVTFDEAEIDLPFLRVIENAIRYINSKGWQINDSIQIAVDESDGSYFLYDLSNASRNPNADDSAAIRSLYQEAGAKSVLALLANSTPALAEATLKRGIKVNYIYASMSRPLSSWFRPEGIERSQYCLIHSTATPSFQQSVPHTWICSEVMFADKQVESYELTLAYARWPLPIHI